MTDVLVWLGRCLLRWPLGVLVGLGYLGLLAVLGVDSAWPVRDYLDTTLAFAWFGMPIYLGVLAWRSGRPAFRVWAVASSWLVFLPFVTVLLGGWSEQASQSLLIATITFGALVPERPTARVPQPTTAGA